MQLNLGRNLEPENGCLAQASSASTLWLTQSCCNDGTTQRRKKGERILKWRLHEQAELIGAKYGIVIGQQWVEKWSQRHKKSNQSEKRQHKLSLDEQVKYTQDFHEWQRSIAENPQFVLYPEDHVNADEVPDSLVGYLSKSMKSSLV